MVGVGHRLGVGGKVVLAKLFIISVEWCAKETYMLTNLKSVLILFSIIPSPFGVPNSLHSFAWAGSMYFAKFPVQRTRAVSA